MEFESDLVVDRPNGYNQDRTRHMVHVVRIEPATWDPSSEIPIVYVGALLTVKLQEDALWRVRSGPPDRAFCYCARLIPGSACCGALAGFSFGGFAEAFSFGTQVIAP